MFSSLKAVLLSVFAKIANTQFLRALVVAGVVIPLVITMYEYMDEVLFNAENAMRAIESAQISSNGRSFPVGDYAISFFKLAQFDTVLTTIFTYMTTAIVWSFTYDLKPLLTRK